MFMLSILVRVFFYNLITNNNKKQGLNKLLKDC